MKNARTIWLFSRPHTIIATSLQIAVGACLALPHAPGIEWLKVLLDGVVMLAAGLGLNIYVVGINQLTDIEIDRMNKPGLPLVSEDLSLSEAAGWVLSSGLLSLLAGFYLGGAWTLGVALILLLGTLYSCEPFRLKNNAVWAGLTIATCRGIVFNVTTYVTWWGLSRQVPVNWSPVIALCAFMFAFVLSIGLFKDLPDYEGDKAHHVMSYAVRFGRKRAFLAGVGFLSLTYLLLIGASVLGWGIKMDLGFALLQLSSLVVLLASAFAVKRFQKEEFVRFYRVVWGLFYFGLVTFSFSAVSA